MLNIFDIQHFSVQDGPGIRVTVFLKGCNLDCRWCHNPESKSVKNILLYYDEKCVKCQLCKIACPNGVHCFLRNRHWLDRSRCIACGKCVGVCPQGALDMAGRLVSDEELFDHIERDLPFFAHGGGVTFSGGEPLLQAKALLPVLQKCRECRIHTAIETAGFVPRDNLSIVLPYTDLLLFDIKAITDDIHRIGTGKSNQSVLKNFEYCYESFTGELWVRIPLIPGFNASGEEMQKIGGYLNDKPRISRVELLPYHDTGVSKYQAMDEVYRCRGITAPSGEQMVQFKDILKKLGVKNII